MAAPNTSVRSERSMVSTPLHTPNHAPQMHVGLGTSSASALTNTGSDNDALDRILERITSLRTALIQLDKMLTAGPDQVNL
jgi:hypothetical protein